MRNFAIGLCAGAMVMVGMAVAADWPSFSPDPQPVARVVDAP